MSNATGALAYASISPQANPDYIPAIASPFRYLPEQRTARAELPHYFFQRPVVRHLPRFPFFAKTTDLTMVPPGKTVVFTAVIHMVRELTGGRRILILIDARGDTLDAHVEAKVAHPARRLLREGTTRRFTAVTRHPESGPVVVTVTDIQAVRTR